MTDQYADRASYRALHNAADLTYYRVTLRQTDLHIGTKTDLRAQALKAVLAARNQVEAAISDRPRFGVSLEPLPPHGSETPLISGMLRAGQAASVGPMAAVAGAIAEFTGRALMPASPDGVVENGGDVFLWGDTPRTVAVFAGQSPLSGVLGVRVTPGDGLAVCTSSGTVGHSLSLGRADAAMIIARDAALADAAATMLGNLCTQPEAIEAALNAAMAVPGVLGALVILGDKLGVRGQVELTALSE